MSDPGHILTEREAEALSQAGVTAISPAQKWTLFAWFALTLLAVPVVQLAAGDRTAPGIFTDVLPRVARAWSSASGGFFDRVFSTNAVALEAMSSWETALADSSRINQAILPRMQLWIAHGLGAGNEKAYPGRDGWLFFRPGLDSVTGRPFLDPGQVRRRSVKPNEYTEPAQPDPREAVLDFARQLEARGIRLVLVPAPVKAVIHPEKLTGRAYAAPVQNPSFDAFVREMEQAGVAVFDPAPLLAARAATGEPQFLATDTHWTPGAMRAVAEALVDFLRARGLAPEPGAPLTRQSAKVSNSGDIAAMLKLPADARAYPPQTVEIARVEREPGAPWQPDPAASVLLLGDSFANIYSMSAMGWGSSAGFAEQLAAALAAPLDAIRRNDAGAHATREMLSREQRRGRDRLAGKKVVVWEFASRELAVGDWKMGESVSMDLGEPRPSRMLDLPLDAATTVTATIAAIEPAPPPGSVPYKDHLVAANLTDLRDPAGTPPVGATDAMAYFWSMRDNVLTPAASYRVGDTIRVKLRPWTAVPQLDGINRRESAALDLQLEPHHFAEPVE